MCAMYETNGEYREIDIGEILNSRISDLVGGPGRWRIVKIIAVIIVLLIVLPQAYFVIDPGEEGIIRRFGKYMTTAEAGIHLKIPFVDRVSVLMVAEAKRIELGFRTAEAGVRTRYETASYIEESEMLTADKNIADIQFIVQYQIKDARHYLFNMRDPDGTLRDVAQSVMRQLIGDRSIDEAIEEREEIKNEAHTSIQEIMDSYPSGIHITLVELKDALPPTEVRPAWDEVNAAIQNRQRSINQAEEERYRATLNATGQAEEVRKKAEGYKIERLYRARGESKRFLEILGEYRKAKEVTKTRLYLETM